MRSAPCDQGGRCSLRLTPPLPICFPRGGTRLPLSRRRRCGRHARALRRLCERVDKTLVIIQDMLEALMRSEVIVAFLSIVAAGYFMRIGLKHARPTATVLRVSALSMTILFPMIPSLFEYKKFDTLSGFALHMLIGVVFLSFPAIIISGSLLILYACSASFRNARYSSIIIAIGCSLSLILDAMQMQHISGS